jgi:hypothetical protein
VGKDRNTESSLHTPGQKRHSKTERNLMINNFYFCMVTSRVEDFCVEKKTVPTCKNLLPVMREEVNVPWGAQYLRRLVHKTGFR